MALDIGGEGESALIGDPAVILWKDVWHMYYEGTDRCDGLDNRIFHATADSIFGPWVKQGKVEGISGNLKGSGLSWPSVFVENDNLYLYYTDGSVRLYAARAINNSGHKFEMENNGLPVISELVNEGSVSGYKNGYRLIYDLFQGKAIKVTESDNKFHFSPGEEVILPSTSGWDGARVGLPYYLPKEKSDGVHDRIYYVGWNDSPKIGLCILSQVMDISDVKVYLSHYGSSDTEKDLNGDGLVNGLDFGEMVLLIN